MFCQFNHIAKIIHFSLCGVSFNGHFSEENQICCIFAEENVEIHLRMKKMGLGMLLGGLGMLAGCLSPSSTEQKSEDENTGKSYKMLQVFGRMTTRRPLLQNSRRQHLLCQPD